MLLCAFHLKRLESSPGMCHNNIMDMNKQFIKKRIRKLTAFAIAVTMLAVAAMPAFAFSDNESRSVENFFIEAQLLKGDGSGYGLDKTANRLEGIIILIRLMGKESEALSMGSRPCRFADVPDWARGYVNYAYEENISKGVSGDRFGVGDKLTAEQYNTLLLRVLGYDDSRGDFQWNASVDQAKKLSILPSDMAWRYVSTGVYTKGDLMETSFCYLEANFKGKGQTLIAMLTETGVIDDGLAERFGLNVESWKSLETGFDKDNYLNFKLSGDELNITGASQDVDNEFLLVRINTLKTGEKKEEKIGAVGDGGKYDISLSLSGLPKGEYYVDVYSNDERYNYYTSIILSSLILQKTEDGMSFKVPPVYGRDLRFQNGNQIEPLNYEMTSATESSKAAAKAVSELAEKITAGLSDDYEKVQAIHGWVTKEIYYDRDYAAGKTKRTNIDSIDVLNNKYAVCSGYANLTNDLLAAAGIPSKQVYGYALGITDVDRWDEMDPQNAEPNHVWNEAYVGGRWVIFDTTWGSSNTYEGGKFSKGKGGASRCLSCRPPIKWSCPRKGGLI